MKTVRTKSRSSKKTTRKLAYRASPKRTRKPKSARTVVNTEPATLPAEAPKPHVPPFEAGEPSMTAPLMVLIRAMFTAPNAQQTFDDPSAEFMSNMLLTLADEAELSGAANNGLDLGEVQGRAMYRLDQRACLGVEIARRIQAGEVTL